MILEVTQEDIDKGRRETPGFCPIAWALRESGFDAPRVFQLECVVGVEGDRTTFPATRPMQQFIAAFDGGGKQAVRPTRFRIPVARP